MSFDEIGEFFRKQEAGVLKGPDPPPIKSTIESTIDPALEGFGEMPYRGVLEPAGLEVTEIPVPGYDAPMRVIGLSEADYNMNAAAIQERITAAMGDGSFLSRVRATPEGVLALDLGGLLLGTGLGIALGAALHNSTQMFLVGIATGIIAEDPFTSVLSVMPQFGDSLIDWADRMRKVYHDTGKQEMGRIMFVRSGDKWIPAIVRGDREPTYWASPVDFAGWQTKWKDIHKLTYETGYGLYLKNGVLHWRQKGVTSQLYARKHDMMAGNQEEWKPWLQYWIPSNEDQIKYANTELLKPLDAVPLSKVFDDLGSSQQFRSMVQLINFAHENQHLLESLDPSAGKYWSGMTDPFYATKWNKHTFIEEPLHPETFRDGYEWEGFYGADIASLLSWNMESANPDNWWQVKNTWSRAGDSRDYVNNITEFFLKDIQKQYAALGDRTKAELRERNIGQIPHDSADMSKLLHQIKHDRSLSEEARQFRIAQETARFFTRHTGHIDLGEGYDEQFKDTLGADLLNQYKQSTYEFAQMHPHEFVTQEFTSDRSRQYAILYGETEHSKVTKNTSALGFYSVPAIEVMPTITKTSRAFIQAHNMSKPPVIGVLKKAEPPTFGDPLMDPTKIPGDGYVWDDEFSHSWIKADTSTGGFHTKLPDGYTDVYNPMKDPMKTPGENFVWDDEFSHSWIKSNTSAGGFHTVLPAGYSDAKGITATGDKVKADS